MSLSTEEKSSLRGAPSHQGLPDADVPGGYEEVSLAGRGTWSEVWKARERASGRFCALKRLRVDAPDGPNAAHLLRNEAQIGRAVDSRYVVRTLDSGLSDARPYTVLEWVEGTTLEEKLEHGERLPVREAVWIARQTAMGLRDLTGAGYAHGDLKPANIFVMPSGEVKIGDLGFAKPVRHDRQVGGDPLLTGTPEYMAPEIVGGDTRGHAAADVYSLGVTLYRMLAGRLPFRGETVAQVLRQQRQGKPPALEQFAPQVPGDLSRLLTHMLAKQPLRRPRNLDDVIRKLIDIELAALLQNA